MSLSHIAALMDELGLNYDFGEYVPDEEYPLTFWVGEFFEEPTLEESGRTAYELRLVGTVFGSFSPLEAERQKIKDKFIMGYRAVLNDGSSIHIRYNGSNFVPSEDQDIKRAEVNLMVQEWKVY